MSSATAAAGPTAAQQPPGMNGGAGVSATSDHVMNGGTSCNNPTSGPGGVVTRNDGGWRLGGPEFSSAREVYTRSLFRVCLKFTTSEDEDEGKIEPATSFWTTYGRDTTIGNGPRNSATPDDICRRMDDSMSGPGAGVLARLSDADGPQAAERAKNGGLTCGWYIRGDRGDAAVRVGSAKVVEPPRGSEAEVLAAGGGRPKAAIVLSLDASRWELVGGASFTAGNSVFNVEEVLDGRQLTICCSKGPMKGKMIDITSKMCPFVFGRAHEADLCIMDRELSRKHGAVLFLPKRGNKKGVGSFVLADLESTNGTYMRLVGPYRERGFGGLSLDDEFIVGRTGFSVNRFDYGISEAIGARPTMEDRVLVLQTLIGNNGGKWGGEPKEDLHELAMTAFAAVFDGHGGDECSNYMVEALPRNLRSFILAERDGLRTAVNSSRGPRGHSEQHEDAACEIMRRIIKEAFLKTDKDFISPKTAPQSGSTAATVILLGRRLFACNVGDSRVVLCRNGGQCVELTSDHKPSRPDEAARVRAAGGFILHKRVMGELAITRAFGDKSFKMGIKAMLEEEADDMSESNGDKDLTALTAPLVTAEPEIASLVLSHNDEFLLLACDGLFDVFRSQDAVALVRQELIARRGEPAEVARILSDQAIHVRRSRDNVSILIIVLRPFWEPSS
uniref:PPM-type phosphatase domain-containing protein n=1 Tax=Corethron hystrix TaxID=216773 RepID=A0A7S1FNH8_9STRA|mmetsp:Transcript_15082/g.33651  ORF Transcript_15082/g.33651 Transcript_15082/m.33651 type:complete len:673 (+) Transcript_15082:457-2475(+)|eukprot:CAMPEP_0113312820 /NCGR_PEP_ID=MMETSP0010_2-20120614/9498_1 /TAXON_ID=216773 ORGANISM="Corethron hystrix, Strain 308" /NCGR_SAMPLE_ID=MMETSP0010_2 /ASSEMBLY_ACC=CAM_ASM_000155 /LENGTH=672 /DNA_ID=CAMNT_0000168723 /DNA_START=292 /DNA_END=2310 /DNA_ORIENTATION=+ /assembly_acc=CAM_ASM_000155